MPVIVQNPRAKADIAEIWDYIADDNASRADALIDTIDQKFQTLAKQPNMGRQREELAAGLRSFPVHRYMIFYLVIPDGIQIVRVLHSARDLDAVFNPDE